MGAADFGVREASRDELAHVVAVQRRAFGRVAECLGIDPALMSPIQESAADLEALFDRGARFFVAVTHDGRIIGAVRGSETPDGVHIGRLVVDNGWERRGVATAVMDALEAAYPSTHRFELFTGEKAVEPLTLYLKRGYTQFRREDLGHVVLVWLEKRPVQG